MTEQRSGADVKRPHGFTTSTSTSVLGWAAVAVLVGYAGGGIAMDIMTTAMSVVGLFTDDEVLPFAPDWPGMVSRLAAVAVAIVLSVWLVRRRRVASGCCAGCGSARRSDVAGATPARRRDLRRAARIAAYLSILPAGGYGLLKLHWALGGAIGLDDPRVFEGITIWSPGFADTSLMALVGIVVAVGMTHRWRVPRVLLLTPAVIGLTMLVPVSVLGTGSLITASTSAQFSELGMASWTTWFVYGSFSAWAVCLSIVTLEYRRATAGPCRSCGRVRHATIAS